MSTQRHAPNRLGAYAYDIVPPQSSNWLDRIRALLEGETVASATGVGAWAGRLILEQRVTHILIVSDTPLRDREINRNARLRAVFSVTEPIGTMHPKA
jgi:hypothetical protein